VDVAVVQELVPGEGVIEPPATTDRDLAERARRGDTEAFGELVERYKRRAYYAALGLVGSHEDALDLSQEAFARAFRARRRLDPERPFYAWLYQILRRLCFNHYRDLRTRRRRLEQATPWLVTQAAGRAAEASPVRRIELEELRDRVRDAIEELSEFEREVLVLREFEGLKYREIADLLGIPIGTVMSRLYTARRHLAQVLEDGS
jgi:RNA polymerase sigma-70 factor (ECF subfamily)